MEIKETFMEVVHAVDELFKYIFKHLEKEGAKESATIRAQFNVPPFVYLEKTPMLTFSEGVSMLREAGIGTETIPEDLSEFDLSTELEKALGHLVKQRFNTDYYILLKYPAKSRPFYSMPCPDNPVFSNTFDVFMRGEEIASGAQRIHDAVLLKERCEALGVPLQQLKSYVEALELGAPPHGGMGAGLERIVMLYYGVRSLLGFEPFQEAGIRRSSSNINSSSCCTSSSSMNSSSSTSSSSRTSSSSMNSSSSSSRSRTSSSKGGGDKEPSVL
ncbi:hypothetical protein Emag_007740 [Eimeria magna]